MHRILSVVGAIAACFFLAYFGAAFHEHPPVTSQDFAAWVQAIGSIGAIAAAIYILDRQNRNAEKLQRRAEDISVLRKYSGIAAIVDHANDLIQDARVRLCDPHMRADFFGISYSPAAFHDVERALVAIPLHDLWSYQMVVGVREMCDLVRAVKTIVSDVSKDPEGFITTHSDPLRSLIALAKQSAEAREEVGQSIAKLGE
jgi:hypothetical protein